MRHWGVSGHSDPTQKETKDFSQRFTVFSDAFCLFYDAKTKVVSALNGSGRAPNKLNIDYLKQRGLKGQIPLTDLNSVTVPGSKGRISSGIFLTVTILGAAAAWVDTISHFGSGSVSISDIFEPAIRLAEEGYVAVVLNCYDEHLKGVEFPFLKYTAGRSVIPFFAVSTRSIYQNNDQFDSGSAPRYALLRFSRLGGDG